MPFAIWTALVIWTGYLAEGGELRSAAMENDVAAAQRLLAGQANINERDASGWTPLHWTAWAGHATMTELLLSHSADVNAKNEAGFTPLHRAAERGHVPVAELLLSHGANVHAKTKDKGNTPLHSAAEGGHVPVAELLLAHGADVHTKSKMGHTPLHSASRKGHVPMAAMLLSHNADLNAKDTDGKTALHLAAYWNKYELARFLLANGADNAAKDNTRKTPRSDAKDKAKFDAAVKAAAQRIRPIKDFLESECGILDVSSLTRTLQDLGVESATDLVQVDLQPQDLDSLSVPAITRHKLEKCIDGLKRRAAREL
jgi:cytohesin